LRIFREEEGGKRFHRWFFRLVRRIAVGSLRNKVLLGWQYSCFWSIIIKKFKKN